MTERVRLEIRDDVAYVTLDRADKRNALDWDMLVGLVDAAERIGRDASLRAVVLRGEGKAFCSGLDFPSFTKTPVRLARAFAKPRPGASNLFQEAALCFRRLPVPVIAVLLAPASGAASRSRSAPTSASRRRIASSRSWRRSGASCRT